VGRRRVTRGYRRSEARRRGIAAGFVTLLVLWDLFGHLPLPLGVAGHEGSTCIVALNGMRLLTNRSWRKAASAGCAGPAAARGTSGRLAALARM
jgi:cobalt/nickel-transporting P-type ATPase D